MSEDEADLRFDLDDVDHADPDVLLTTAMTYGLDSVLALAMDSAMRRLRPDRYAADDLEWAAPAVEAAGLMCEIGAGGLVPRREYWDRPAIDFVSDFVRLAEYEEPA